MPHAWNGLPPDPTETGAHWLRYKRTGHVALYEWSDLCECWFAFGVSGTDSAERMAREMEYIAPAIPPGQMTSEVEPAPTEMTVPPWQMKILNKVMSEPCGCMKCFSERCMSTDLFCMMTTPGFRYACEVCGNKRCPHHTDHTLVCTSSNYTGQPGSIYE